MQLEKLLNISFDFPISNIDKALHEIRSQVESKSDNANALRIQLDEVIKLRAEIQRTY